MRTPRPTEDQIYAIRGLLEGGPEERACDSPTKVVEEIVQHGLEEIVRRLVALRVVLDERGRLEELPARAVLRKVLVTWSTSADLRTFARSVVRQLPRRRLKGWLVQALGADRVAQLVRAAQ